MKFNQKKAIAFINKMIRANNSKTADIRVPQRPLIDENGYQIIGNDKFFVRFFEPVSGYTEILTAKPTFYQERQHYRDTYKLICSNIVSNSHRFNTELTTPEIESLKLMIKESRLKETKYHFILNTYPCVNARYLLDIMSVFPDARFFFDPTERYPMVYVRSEFGDAILTSLKL